MTLRSTIMDAMRQLNPMRESRLSAIRRESERKQMQALRKMASDRLTAGNAARVLIEELKEEKLQLAVELRKTKSRLVALKGLLVKLGTDQLDESTRSIH